jgi:MFS family permease
MSFPPPVEEMTMTMTITIDEAIERLGYGKFQIRVMIAAGLCFAADAMEVLLLSFLSVVLQALWELTIQETAILTSIVFLGQFLGTLVLGPLGDKIGRRPVFMLAAIIITIFGVATAFCNTFTALVIVRMMVGFGVGGLTVAFDTLAELLPVHCRGRDLLFIDYFWTLGTLCVPLAAWLTLGNENEAEHDNENGWRYFVILCALPCFISTIMGYWLVPESPRWLLTQGKGTEALEVLRKGAVANGKDPMTIYPEGTTLQTEEPEASSIKDLFTPAWRWITIPMWVTWCGFAFLYYGTILLTTNLFSESAENTDVSDAYAFDYGAIFVSGTAEIFGTTFAILGVDTLGRRPVQMISYTIGGICILILSIFSQIDAGRGGMITFAFFARLFMMAGNITTWVATAEILTTEIRTTGHSYANAMARVGGFAAPYLIQETKAPLLIGGIMFSLAMVTAFTSSRLPETKGKALGVHLNTPSHDELELQVPSKPIV